MSYLLTKLYFGRKFGKILPKRRGYWRIYEAACAGLEGREAAAGAKQRRLER